MAAICPKGWRLPTHSEQSGITNYASAFSPVFSGQYDNGSLDRAGSIGIGYWWSATATNGSLQYYLSYNGSSLNAINGSKYYGKSVRCIRSNPGTLTINFNGNAYGSPAVGTTASQQIAAGSTASLNANGFTRNGYAFTGWNTAADGSGTSYADGADYAVTPATGDVTVTLYAQWAPSMQDFTLAQCQSLASAANYTVVDSRDGSDYTVRYINGACWMTQNLRLPGGTTLTTSDSNVTRNYTLPTTQLDGLGSESYTEPQTTISSNTSYGGYYNYCAASAGTVCSGSSAQDAAQDICPKGWRLPTYNEQNGIRSYASAFSPVDSGRYDNGSLNNTGSRGNWWSATARNGLQYYLYYNGSSLSTDDTSRDSGLSVRCIRSS